MRALALLIELDAFGDVLAASCPELEAKLVGNPARHRLYRVVVDRP
jgi:hypothetical protein